jgi:predicted Holliday junction resolvase-like endonuclease
LYNSWNPFFKEEERIVCPTEHIGSPTEDADQRANSARIETSSWAGIASFLLEGMQIQEVRYLKAIKIAEFLKGRAHQMEPFFFDFSQNPTFVKAREEKYSNHLVWLLENLKWDNSFYFDLFKIDTNDPIRQACIGTKPTLRREVQVEEGHEGQCGRIDILMIFKNVIIDIEVKVVDADNADKDKNAGYRASLEIRYPKGKFFHRHRLLVTDAKKDYYNEKPGDEDHGESYFVILWEHICLWMRQLVYSGAFTDDPFMESQFLTFAGSVEQCLLGYQFLDKDRRYIDSRSLTYLEKVANESTEQEEKMNEEDKNPFFKEGAKNYFNALRVIRDYEKLIKTIAENALSKKMKLLFGAMQLESLFNSTIILPYSNQELDNGWAYIGVKIDLSIFRGLYALYGLVEFDNKGKINVSVILQLSSATLKDKVMAAANKVEYIGSGFVENASAYEVYIEKPIDQVDQATLAESFEILLDQWINFLRAEDIKKILEGS